MKPNVGIEPTTYRLIEFAVSILKLVWDAGFEPATSHFQGEPSDLADNNPS